ncbi:MAG: hypothetical protein H6598_09865 [Flavobacteriales bacterium]|nr:hypothetical protein [Flavobacteriales bacterium]
MLNKHKWGFLEILFFVIVWSYGQDKEKSSKEIKVNWGLSNDHLQNDNFSPLVYSSSSVVNFGLGFLIEKKTKHNISAYFHSNKMAYQDYVFETPFTIEGEKEKTYPHVFDAFRLRYDFRIRQLTKDKYSLELGVSSENTLQQYRYFFGSASYFGYYFMFSGAAYLKGYLNLPKDRKVSLYANLPFVSYVSRSPYLQQNDDYFENNYEHRALKSLFGYINDGHFQFPNELRAFDITAEFIYPLKEKLIMTFGYSLYYNQNINPQNFILIRNQLIIGLNIKL